MLLSIRDICVFTVTTYLEPWFTATWAPAAPRTDLQLLTNILNYSAISKEVSECAFGAFKNHLWYLSEENVALALFDPQVNNEIKRQMVLRLNVEPKKKAKQARFRHVLNAKADVKSLKALGLPDFVNSNTRQFLSILRVNDEFLNVDPLLWTNNPSYLEAEATVRALAVVNDVAERGVALVKDYNCTVTHDENEFQKVLLVS